MNWLTRRKICKQCNAQPAHKGYDYCGKTCAGLARSIEDTGNPYGNDRRFRAPVTVNRRFDDYDEDRYGSTVMCANCQVEPAYGNLGYCTKACESEAQERVQDEYARRTSKSTFRSGRKYSTTQYDEDEEDYSGEDGDGVPSRVVVVSNRRNLCMNCRSFEKVAGFDFCSRICLSEATTRLTSLEGQTTIRLPMPRRPPGAPCKVPGCKGFEFTPGAKYCGNKCRKAAVTLGIEAACLLCGLHPKTKRHFCGKSCSQTAEANAPQLLDVPQKDPKFADIVKQFNASWKGGAAPTVHRICKVVNAKATEDRFQAYRKTVEAAGNFSGAKKSAGNELRRWHGTLRQCTIGDNPASLTACASTGCSLCCVIRTSFDIQYIRRGSYGHGIYTSAFSSTSNGYSRAGTVGSPYKAMFLTRVVAGAVHLYGTNGVPTGGGPPAGHHSVAIDAAHTELIVFQNDAICPSWLVMYS